MPLVVAVVGDRAGGADARVVDQDVDATAGRRDLVDGGPHGGVVGDVGDERGSARDRRAGFAVEHRDGRAAGRQERGGRGTDAGGAAGDHRHEPGELGCGGWGVGHGSRGPLVLSSGSAAVADAAVASAAQTGPSG